jgi:hypothetical protein
MDGAQNAPAKKQMAPTKPTTGMTHWKWLVHCLHSCPARGATVSNDAALMQKAKRKQTAQRRERTPGIEARAADAAHGAHVAARRRSAWQRSGDLRRLSQRNMSQQRAEQQSAHPSWQAKSPASGPAWQDFCMGQENSTAEVLMERLRRGTRKSATAAQEQLSTPRSAHASAAHHQLGSASRRSPAGQVAPMGQGRQVPPARRLNSPPLQGSQKRRSEEACVPGGHGAMVKLPGAAEQGRA